MRAIVCITLVYGFECWFAVVGLLRGDNRDLYQCAKCRW